jgi:hypothetical protein
LPEFGPPGPNRAPTSLPLPSSHLQVGPTPGLSSLLSLHPGRRCRLAARTRAQPRAPRPTPPATPPLPAMETAADASSPPCYPLLSPSIQNLHEGHQWSLCRPFILPPRGPLLSPPSSINWTAAPTSSPSTNSPFLSRSPCSRHRPRPRRQTPSPELRRPHSTPPELWPTSRTPAPLPLLG